MRILEVITLGETGGAQTVLVDLLKGFSERGGQAEIDVVFGPGEYVPQALAAWFKGRVLQMPWLVRSINPHQDLKALMALKKLCRTRSYDIVHCHSSKASWLARLAATWAGVPRICMTVHGLSYHPGNSPLVRLGYKTMEKAALPLATDYVFVSQRDMVEMTELGLDTAKCRLIPNGRPVPPRPVTGLRKLLNIPAQAPVICMIARLSAVKNPLAFVNIAHLVVQQYPPDMPSPHFVLIGDGPLFGACREAISQAGMGNVVHLAGEKEAAAQFFWDADIALLTSNYEACPLVAIEALATGTPVVASNVGGTGDVVRHGETGYLYAQNNEQEAAQHILSLLTNTDQRKNMGHAALERYRQEFTPERMVNQYAELFGL